MCMSFLAAYSRLYLTSSNLAALARSDRNCEGTEFGKTIKNGGNKISAPGIKMKKEKGINLMTSILTCLTLRS